MAVVFSASCRETGLACRTILLVGLVGLGMMMMMKEEGRERNVLFWSQSNVVDENSTALLGYNIHPYSLSELVPLYIEFQVHPT